MGCSSDCQLEGCGDEFVDTDAGEACDDGNGDKSDGCPDDVANGGSCAFATCGDGFLHAGVEDCDDGNLVSGDGCDASCIIE